MKGLLRLRNLRPPRFLATAGCLLGAVLAFGTWASADTKIYRYEDSHGLAVFADRLSTGWQEVVLPAVNAYTPTEPKTPASISPPTDVAGSYRSLLVTSPGNGETIRRNGGNVRVTGRIEPGVREDHRAVLLVDGTMTSRESLHDRIPSLQDTDGNIEFALTGVARGPHTLRIAIMDGQNNVLIESPPVHFHLLRAAAGQLR